MSNDYIMLIEDSPSQALQLRLLLQQVSSLQVRVVSDGVEGWRQACTDNPRLILLDINLPSLDGFQILSRLKRNRETVHIPVIMLTTSDSVSDVERAISLGASDYLFKDDCLFKSKEAREQLHSAVYQFVETSTNDS